MKWFPYEKLYIYSELSPEEIQHIIAANTQRQNFRFFHNKDEKYFEGTVDNYKFYISKNLSGRNSYNPSIKGTIFPKDHLTEIEISFSLNVFTLFASILIYSFLLFLIIYSCISGEPNMYLIPLSFFVVTYLFMFLNFNYLILMIKNKLFELIKPITIK
jgi:hypothetical protein